MTYQPSFPFGKEQIEANNRKLQEENARKQTLLEQRALQAKLIKAANDWNKGCGLDNSGNPVQTQPIVKSRWAKDQTLSEKLSRLPGTKLPQPRLSREEKEDMGLGAYIAGQWVEWGK